MNSYVTGLIYYFGNVKGISIFLRLKNLWGNLSIIFTNTMDSYTDGTDQLFAIPTKSRTNRNVLNCKIRYFDHLLNHLVIILSSSTSCSSCQPFQLSVYYYLWGPLSRASALKLRILFNILSFALDKCCILYIIFKEPKEC